MLDKIVKVKNRFQALDHIMTIMRQLSYQNNILASFWMWQNTIWETYFVMLKIVTCYVCDL